MRFARLLAVVFVATIGGGAFGAGVGALAGFAVPSYLKAAYGVGPSQAAPTPPADANQLRVGLQFNSVGTGAAFGGVGGLVLGAGLGLALGVLDQMILLIRVGPKKRNPVLPASTSQPSGAVATA